MGKTIFKTPTPIIGSEIPKYISIKVTIGLHNYAWGKGRLMTIIHANLGGAATTWMAGVFKEFQFITAHAWTASMERRPSS